MPDGWEMRALFNRLIKEGYTDYEGLKRGTIRDVYNMLLMLEWNDHATAHAEIAAKARQ